MATVIDCPACSRQVRLPDELVGQLVKCPVCAHTFTADPGGADPTAREREAPDPVGTSAGPLPDEQIEDQPRSGRQEAAPWERYEVPRPGDDLDEGLPPWRHPGPYGSRGEALAQVSGPATAILVITILGMIGLGCNAVVNVINMAGAGMGAGMQGGGGGGQADAMAGMFGGAFGLVQCAVAAVIYVLILIGVQKMKNLESYGWAMTSAILSVVPCTSPCCILGIPFGIWALVILNKPEVKAAFDQ